MTRAGTPPPATEKRKFPQTARTWIEDHLVRGDAGQAEVNHHLMSVYADPLRAYLACTPYRSLGEAEDLVQGFFRTLAGRGAPERAAVIKGNLDTALIRPVMEPLTPIQKVLAMQRVPVFSRMSAIEMRHLAAIAHQFELEADAVVSGTIDAPMVYVVLSGALSLEVPDSSVPPIPAGP